jgi:hypothetical protein
LLAADLGFDGFQLLTGVRPFALGDQIASFTPVDFLYAWNKNGTALSGFPAGPLNAINCQVSIGDIDNDNNMELICDDHTTVGGMGKYLAFNHDGTPLSGWPIVTAGTSFFSTPMLGDVNRDGILDIAGTGSISSTINVYLWNTQLSYNPLKIVNPMWQYNSRHNGVYGDNPLVGIAPVNNNIPQKYNLLQNYPNPFNPTTNVKFQIPIEGFAKLTVFDILGRETTTLVSESLKPGIYEVTWDGANYPSGVYFYKFTAGEYSETRKMILLD